MHLYRKGQTKSSWSESEHDIRLSIDEDNSILIEFNEGAGRGIGNFKIVIPVLDIPGFMELMSTALASELTKPVHELTVPELLDLLRDKTSGNGESK